MISDPHGHLFICFVISFLQWESNGGNLNLHISQYISVNKINLPIALQWNTLSYRVVKFDATKITNKK